MSNESNSCLLRIREATHALTPKENQLATYLLENAEEAVTLSIDELAMQCEVSVSTVVRLCKTLGYRGYKELIRNLYLDLSSPADEVEFEDINPGDDPVSVMRSICQCNIKAIENTLAIMDVSLLISAVEKLCLAPRIDFYGAGTSGLVALDASNKFVRCGKTVVAHSDPHTQVLTALTLKPGDVAVLISHSGETTDIVNLARTIRSTGATLISLTRYGPNTLCGLADISLFSSSTETAFRIGPMSSRVAQLTVVDVLYTAVCSACFDQAKAHLEASRQAVEQMHLSPAK